MWIECDTHSSWEEYGRPIECDMYSSWEEYARHFVGLSPTIFSPAQKAPQKEPLGDILADRGLSKHSALWSGCSSLSSTKPAHCTRGIQIPVRWRPRVIWWATESITPRPDLTCLTTYPSTHPERDTHPIPILASART